MPRQNIVGNRTYLFSPDDPVPLADRDWGLISVRVFDELVNEPPRGDMNIETTNPRLTPRIAENGLLGFVGKPIRAFPALNTQSYVVDFTVRVAGYLPRSESLTIPIIPTFPTDFSPTRINLQLHREPIVISGRTVDAVGNVITPIAGMTVSITGIWPTLPPGNVLPPPADPPRLLSLRPTLYFPRTAATGTVTRREMVPVVGLDKQLNEFATAGDSVIQLSDRVGLNVGDILAVDAVDTERLEFLTIQFIAPSTTTTSVSRITVSPPLALNHNRDVLVQRVLPQAPGFSNPLSRDAQTGDVCVFLNSMTDLAAANVVEIAGAVGDPVEYHRISRFITTSNADGYFSLPLLSRVAQVEIQADDGGVHPTTTRRIVPNYATRETRLDFVF